MRGEVSGEKINFSTWVPFEDALKYATDETGVYIIRMKDGMVFGRVKGESDIVYIGETKSGFKRRFRGYLKPNGTQWTNWRVNSFSKKHKLEVSFAPATASELVEHMLLQTYQLAHEELPPLNRAEARIFYANAPLNLRYEEEDISTLQSVNNKFGS